MSYFPRMTASAALLARLVEKTYRGLSDSPGACFLAGCHRASGVKEKINGYQNYTKCLDST